MDDNLMPNDMGSSMFERPVDKERQNEEAAEQVAVVAAAPIYDYILKAFDEEIARAKTIEGLSVDHTAGRTLEGQIEAKKLYAEFLEQGKQYLIDLREQHLH